MTKLYESLKDYTMVPEATFYANIDLAKRVAGLDGVAVECGAWKGGMMAGISTVMGSDRTYVLLDSFEGLPDAEDIDGDAALEYQRNTDLPTYYNNCKTSPKYAKEAMRIVGATKSTVVKGWFENTLPGRFKPDSIALLRIDCDWHRPTALCLEILYDAVMPGGIIIIDDFFAWDGCQLATTTFFEKRKIPIETRDETGLCWVVKP
jgi:O-methyltransferase